MIIFFACSMLFSIVLCLMIFLFYCHKNKLAVRSHRATFVFFDSIFFGGKEKLLLNFSALLILMAFLCALGIMVIKMDPDKGVDSVMGYGFGIIGVIFLFLHCRYFSKRDISKGDGKEALKELMSFNTFSARYFFLWLSRFSYLVWLILSYNLINIYRHLA